MKRMWLGDYSFVSLIGIFIQSLFIQNILLFYFLGMCSYLACSTKLKTANGLGIAVFVVITCSGTINWFVHQFITKDGALSWIPIRPIIDMQYLELIIFIATIAAFVQILEVILDNLFPPLYRALGVYLPLITVNCAILGASLFSVVRSYPLIPNIVFCAGTGLGWYLAIVLIASIREKLTYSEIPKNLKGMGITFITTGLIALAFMAFSGINLIKK
ncbi:MAG: Na(+)-translocating NADH-quinone reductase subunit E [Chlamydiia bacterium]|nr:Na(+)-translocating NADH-quinone reductase subunit E [Chlamydiia bacterium]